MVTSCWSISDFLPSSSEPDRTPLLLEERPVGLEQAAERLVVGVALLVGEAGDLLGQRRDRVDRGRRIAGAARLAGEHDGDARPPLRAHNRG